MSLFDWPKPILPEIIPGTLVQWRWKGLWQTRTADFGWFRLVSSKPYFNYRQKALPRGDHDG